eukprot:6873412-Prymnesium_polylepis.5
MRRPQGQQAFQTRYKSGRPARSVSGVVRCWPPHRPEIAFATAIATAQTPVHLMPNVVHSST